MTIGQWEVPFAHIEKSGTLKSRNAPSSFYSSFNNFGSNGHNIGNLHATDELKYNSESLTSLFLVDINHL